MTLSKFKEIRLKKELPSLLSSGRWELFEIENTPHASVVVAHPELGQALAPFMDDLERLGLHCHDNGDEIVVTGPTHAFLNIGVKTGPLPHEKPVPDILKDVFGLLFPYDLETHCSLKKPVTFHIEGKRLGSTLLQVGMLPFNLDEQAMKDYFNGFKTPKVQDSFQKVAEAVRILNQEFGYNFSEPYLKSNPENQCGTGPWSACGWAIRMAKKHQVNDLDSVAYAVKHEIHISHNGGDTSFPKALCDVLGVDYELAKQSVESLGQPPFDNVHFR